MERAFAARHDGYAGLLHGVAGDGLVAHFADGRSRRADELDAALGTDLGEFGVFGQGAIAGVDRVGVGQFSGADDIDDVAVAVFASSRPDADVLVGKRYVQGAGIGLGVDSHGRDAHFLAGADDAQRDFAAVGNEDFLEHSL